jgi:hypothetical protein
MDMICRTNLEQMDMFALDRQAIHLYVFSISLIDIGVNRNFRKCPYRFQSLLVLLVRLGRILFPSCIVFINVCRSTEYALHSDISSSRSTQCSPDSHSETYEEVFPRILAASSSVRLAARRADLSVFLKFFRRFPLSAISYPERYSKTDDRAAFIIERARLSPI